MNNFKEIQELIRLITRMELAEFKMKDGEFELSIRTKHFDKGSKSASGVMMAAPAPSAVPTSAMPSAAPAQAVVPAEAPKAIAPPPSEGGGQYLEVRSPIVGTFYRSPSPDKPAYVKPGDVIKAGDVVCIIEAMKLFNEIESEHGGTVVKVLVEDASPVEFDQVLYLVDPKG
jgi:acetyl-CoA carboxylase biotin carboxyl carrier protein